MTSRIVRLKAIALIDRGVDALERGAVTRAANAATGTDAFDRRGFFKATASSLALAWLAACDSTGPAKAERVLAYATRKNEQIERWLLSHTRMDYGSPGAKVAGDKFPSYFVSDEVPKYDGTFTGPWTLEVSGMVKTPLKLTLDQLRALPHIEQRVDHFCVEGWNAVAVFNGVALRELISMAGVDPSATYVDFQSFDDGYHESWDIESARHPQTLIVYGKDGNALTPAYGAPARVHSPIKLGYKNTKYLTKIVFMNDRNGGYWSDRGYEWFGGT
jgi:DMSO/TMAO reductase YedYZ molybdopterin-dependent catalytic subunit